MKSFELETLLGLLDSVRLSSSSGKGIYSLDPSSVFSCKSYFQFLSHLLNRTSFHIDKPIWESEAIWTAALNSTDTDDMFQGRRLPKAIPLICVLCVV